MKRSEKTEHAGAKNGGGYYGKSADAKRRSRKLRRWWARLLAREE